MVPAVNATVWEQGISTRIVLFRDWAWDDKKLRGVFLAGLEKLDGKAIQGGVEHVCAFKVEAVRLGSGYRPRRRTSANATGADRIY